MRKKQREDVWLNSVGNIYCLGRNYVLHAQELRNEVPTSPMLFMKPTHALVAANGQTVTLPGNWGTIHFETELVIHIGKPYEKGMNADELVDSMTVGIDFTLRDLQDELKKKGFPWLLSKGFKNSAVISRFIPFPGIEEFKKTSFALIKNGEKVQTGYTKDFIFDLQEIIDYTGQHLGLGKGDMIFTGTPQGVGPVFDGDKMILMLGEEILGRFTLKLDWVKKALEPSFSAFAI